MLYKLILYTIIGYVFIYYLAKYDTKDSKKSRKTGKKEREKFTQLGVRPLAITNNRENTNNYSYGTDANLQIPNHSTYIERIVPKNYIEAQTGIIDNDRLNKKKNIWTITNNDIVSVPTNIRMKNKYKLLHEQDNEVFNKAFKPLLDQSKIEYLNKYLRYRDVDITPEFERILRDNGSSKIMKDIAQFLSLDDVKMGDTTVITSINGEPDKVRLNNIRDMIYSPNEKVKMEGILKVFRTGLFRIFNTYEYNINAELFKNYFNMITAHILERINKLAKNGVLKDDKRVLTTNLGKFQLDPEKFNLMDTHLNYVLYNKNNINEMVFDGNMVIYRAGKNHGKNVNFEVIFVKSALDRQKIQREKGEGNPEIDRAVEEAGEGSRIKDRISHRGNIYITDLVVDGVVTEDKIFLHRGNIANEIDRDLQFMYKDQYVITIRDEEKELYEIGKAEKKDILLKRKEKLKLERGIEEEDYKS